MSPADESASGSRRKSKAAVDEEKCSVSGCGAEAVRSISFKKAESALSGLKGDGKRAHLCKAHYKEFKKKTKGERDAERWGWN